MRFDKLTSDASDGDMNLNQYNPTVYNFFIDPTTRVCFSGPHCYDCLLPKFPGYSVSGYTDTADVIKQSRGDLRIIEFSATQYGFSIVTNGKTEIQFSTASLNLAITHVAQGSTRQSFGKWYVQNKDITLHDIYALHDGTGSIAFQKVYTTTDSEIKAHLGYDKAIWWPVRNLLLVRQWDQITWDGYGLNVDSIDVAAAPTTFLPEQQFEPFSTGPIKISGDLTLEPRFCNNYLVLWRENTNKGDNRLSMYKWTQDSFSIIVDLANANVNTATSLVSFGTNGALLWFDKESTGTLYKTDGTTSTITVQVVDAILATTWSGLAAASRALRFIQARADPDNPTENPQVYAFFTNANLFKVTLDTGASKVILDPVVTLDARFKLYQPLDIGQIFLANMVVHPCTVPTVDTDIYTSASVLFYKLDGTGTECIQLTTAITQFD
jgi:hypothetical protein